MLDFGLPELLVILVIAVLVIGPKEIPSLMRGLGRLVRRFQYMRYSLMQQFDDFMVQDDLSKMNYEASRREMGEIDAEIDDDEEEINRTTKLSKTSKGEKDHDS